MGASPTRILIVSNGFGEDIIGARLGRAFLDLDPTLTITPIPLIGEGAAYVAENIHPATQFPIPKSGGFLRTISDVIGDIKNGLIGTLIRQRRTISANAAHADLIIAVGDVFCLLWATGHRKPTVFLPTAKSDLFMPHSWIEYILIRRRAQWIFPRDQITTDAFIQHKLPALFLGNPMMDNLLTQPPLPKSPNIPGIAILPGSRAESGANLRQILNVLDEIQEPATLQAWICRSPHVSEDLVCSILTHHGYTFTNGYWTTPNARIKLTITTQFASAVQAADCVIGLAGTANEQAAWLGKHVIAFPGTGPQSRPIRFIEQGRLIGPQLHFVNSTDPKDIAITVTTTLTLLPSPVPSGSYAAAAIARWVYPVIHD
jgi:uncharacterized protein (TIGR03492 family)